MDRGNENLEKVSKATSIQSLETKIPNANTGLVSAVSAEVSAEHPIVVKNTSAQLVMALAFQAPWLSVQRDRADWNGNNLSNQFKLSKL